MLTLEYGGRRAVPASLGSMTAVAAGNLAAQSSNKGRIFPYIAGTNVVA